MGILEAPHIQEVNPNVAAFRAALSTAGAILIGQQQEGLRVYSHHSHYPLAGGETLFEKRVAIGEVALRPIMKEEAANHGLPSCWGFGHDGEVHVLRHADTDMHSRSSIDVTSGQFKRGIAEVGRAFASAGLHKLLEVNIAGQLFPAEAGNLTLEETDEPNRVQTVTFIPTPPNVAEGDWSAASCWSFSEHGDPFVTGLCNE